MSTEVIIYLDAEHRVHVSANGGYSQFRHSPDLPGEWLLVKNEDWGIDEEMVRTISEFAKQKLGTSFETVTKIDRLTAAAEAANVTADELRILFGYAITEVKLPVEGTIRGIVRKAVRDGRIPPQA